MTRREKLVFAREAMMQAHGSFGVIFRDRLPVAAATIDIIDTLLGDMDALEALRAKETPAATKLGTSWTDQRVASAVVAVCDAINPPEGAPAVQDMAKRLQETEHQRDAARKCLEEANRMANTALRDRDAAREHARRYEARVTVLEERLAKIRGAAGE